MFNNTKILTTNVRQTKALALLETTNMSEDWLKWYMEQVAKNKTWPKYHEKYLCPCYYMPTLDERASFDICTICFWEDDGQDTDDAGIIRGGPNHDYSLKEARENFVKYHTMYRPTDVEHFEREQSQMNFKRQLYQMYSKAMKSGKISDWKEVISVHEKYYEDDEC